MIFAFRAVAVRRKTAPAVRWLAALARGTDGALLMETLIAVTVFSMLGAAVLSGLSTAHRSTANTEDQSVAESIARNQMEQVFVDAYLDPPASYTPVATPPGYSVTVDAQEFVVADPNVAKIIVTVFRAGQQVLVVESLRLKE